MAGNDSKVELLIKVTSDINKAVAGLDSVGKSAEKVATKVSSSFTKSGDKIKAVFTSITTGVGNTFAAIGRSANSLVTKLDAVGGKLRSFGAYGVGIGAAIGYPFINAGRRAAEFNDRLGELGSVGVTNIKEISEAAMEMSNKWAGIRADDYVAMIYDVKSAVDSITDDALPKYADAIAITAKATKASIADMSRAFTTMHGVFREFYKQMTDGKFAEMLSGGISYAAKIYRTDGAQMANAIKGIGASAALAKIPLEEQLAIMGELQTTMSGSEASTQYQSFIMNLSKAAEKLKIQVTNANGNMRSSADIIDLIVKKYKDLSTVSTQAELKQAFGRVEAYKFITGLSDKTDKLRQSTKEIKDAMNGGLQYATEMATHMNTNKFELMSQRLDNIKIKIGDIFTKVVEPHLKTLEEWLMRVQEYLKDPENVAFIEKVITVLGYVAVVAGVLGGIAIILGTVIVPLKYIVLVVSFVFSGISLIAGIVGWVVSFVISGITLIAGIVGWPFILIGLAFAALVAVVWYYWEEYRAALYAFWVWLKEKFAIAGELWGAVLDDCKKAFDAFCDYISEKWNALLNSFAELWQKILPQSWLLGSEFQTVNGVTSRVPGYATGGVAYNKQLAWVAESEPEAIIPVSRLGAVAQTIANGGVYNSGNRSNSVNVGGITINQRPGEDGKALSKRIVRAIQGRG